MKEDFGDCWSVIFYRRDDLPEARSSVSEKHRSLNIKY